jgi:hypothetical protein
VNSRRRHVLNDEANFAVADQLKEEDVCQNTRKKRKVEDEDEAGRESHQIKYYITPQGLLRTGL